MELLRILELDIPFWEIFTRGTLMYLGIFVILRVMLKREVGSIGISDLLMVTLIADAAQNGMTGEYRSVSAGLLLVSTLVFWNFALDWCASRFRWFESLTRARPLCLIRNGNIEVRNLQAAGMSRAELKALLREEGIEKLQSVKYALLEGDGHLSVIKK